MARRVERLFALIAIAVLAACGGSSTSGTSSPALPLLVVAASPTSVAADGVSAVSITISGDAPGAVSVSTTRGLFANSDKVVQVAALPATITLRTCNAANETNCAGPALIRAGDGTGAYGEATVVFTASSTPPPQCTTCGSAACVGVVCDSVGHTCSSGSPSTCSTCPPGTTSCSTVLSQPVLVLAAGSSRIPADGIATTIITATLTQDKTPVPGQTIAFTSSLAGTKLSTSAPTDAAGVTTVVLTSSAAGGETTVTGTFVASATVTVKSEAKVAMPRLAQLTVAGYEFEVLGARHSDFQERSAVTFQALDTASLPYPAGLTVTFTHETLGQSFIGDSYANCTASYPSCQTTGVTDAEGKVLVTLTSGTAAGVVSIDGGATAGGLSASAIAHRLAIIGAKASGAYVVMDCEEDNVPALLYSDCVTSHLVQTVKCKVSMRDRFQNVVGRSTRVQFFSEAGSIGMSAVSPMYATGGDPVGQMGLGIAQSALRTDGKLPVDVAPFGGEFALTYADTCGTYTHNPRDGLVTLIGVVNGEEGYVDLNGNGRYDPGEPYIDMGEPYIDANDNGKWDPGEFYVDVNGNGKYDGPNGVWDQNTVIWAETRVLFTGHSFTIADASTSRLAGSQFYKIGAPPEPVTASPFSVISSQTAAPGLATSDYYAVAFGDRNFNPLATSTGYSVSTTRGVATAAFAPNPVPPFGLDISFTQQYCTKPNWEDITSSAMCSNVCPWNGDAANSPCYVVTNVGGCTAGVSPRSGCGGFAYATTGTVKVTGGALPGIDTVEATATINAVSSKVFLDGVVH